MTDADYTDDLALLTNTPVQFKSLLHSLKQAARGIDLYVTTNKMEFICFKQEGAISTLSDYPLKLIDQFTYLGSNISSTESDVNKHLVKVWTIIDRLTIIWKSGISNKIKQDFFQVVDVAILLYECITCK